MAEQIKNMLENIINVLVVTGGKITEADISWCIYIVNNLFIFFPKR